MKRIMAILICVMMLSTLAVSSSAAEIIWKDDFSAGFSANNWILDGNNFFLDDSDASNPCLAAYESGKVCQMEYRYDMTPTQRIFNNCDFSVKIQLRDYGIDPDDHFFGLWWRDDFVYISDADGGDDGVELGEVWNLIYEEKDDTINLQVEGEETPRVSVPANGKIELGGDWFTFGWKITPGRMCAYLNNEKLIDYSSEDIAATAGSPILLLNGNYYSAWDDVTVADLDYNLFGDNVQAPSEDVTTAPVDDGGDENDVTTAPADAGNDNAGNDNAGNDNAGNDNAGNDNAGNDNAGNDNAGNDNAGNDNAGNDNAGNDNAGNDNAGNNNAGNDNAGNNTPADTNQNKPAGGSSTATGDTAFVVAAVMIAALGCAVVVKKVTVR